MVEATTPPSQKQTIKSPIVPFAAMYTLDKIILVPVCVATF